MRVAYLMGCAHLCALLIVIHDEYDSRPYEPVTSFQQPKEVTKKGRPPTNFLIHIFIRLQCHSGERKHPCKALRLVQTSLSGHLTSRIKKWKIGVVKKSKAATSSPKKLSRETVRFVAYLWPAATMPALMASMRPDILFFNS